MVAKSYYNAAHFAESFQKLGDLRESGETCDIRLLVSNKEIPAHKLVLAFGSEYFKNAIYGLFLNDLDKTELEIKEVKYEILSAVVNYIYTGKIEINSENVYDIFNAADYFLINFLKDKCLDFLRQNIDTDNCFKIWLMANTCKNEYISIAVGKFIFSNLTIATNSKEYLSLSNEQIFDLFELWPKNNLSDSIITSLLKWASNKENWEKTVINILEDIPHTSISDDYLENVLSNNEIMQNNSVCNKWMTNIFKAKLKSSRLKLVETVGKLEEAITPTIEEEGEECPISEDEDEIEFGNFLLDEPIILLKRCNDGTNFYKYNRNGGDFNLYYKRTSSLDADYVTYKSWIYAVGQRCIKFPYDDCKNEKFAFRTDHGQYLRTAILNDAMHIFGGISSELKGSTIDLNTNKIKDFSLSNPRLNPGVAASNGSIYICGGYCTNTIERYDPRERESTFFASIPLNRYGSFCSAAILSNQLYCFGNEYKMIDLRNNTDWVDIEPPFRELNLESRKYANCLISSNGKLYTNIGRAIYEYNNILDEWKWLVSSLDLLSSSDCSSRMICFQ